MQLLTKIGFLAILVVLAFLPEDTEAACTTTGGKSCVFPFKYKNVVYTRCTIANHNEPWCATATAKGNYNGQWGPCDSKSCTGCTTTGGKSCVFPFKYKNVVYTRCTDANHKELWCATATANGNYNGQWGPCDSKYCRGKRSIDDDLNEMPEEEETLKMERELEAEDRGMEAQENEEEIETMEQWN